MKKTLFTVVMAAVSLLAGHAAKKSDVFTTPGGKTVVINHIKHATMQIEYDGKLIYVDPVRQVPPVTDFNTYPQADIILVTHEHLDHFDREAIAALRNVQNTLIYLNKNCWDIYHNGTVMSNGDSIMVDESITLKAVPAYNTTFEHRQFHPKGRDNGYVLSLDGLRIYIAGDTEDIPEMAELQNIDIAFLPCNQPYTMTVEQLAKAAKMFKPKVLFPYHYSDTTIHKVSMLLVGSGIDVRIRDYR